MMYLQRTVRNSGVGVSGKRILEKLFSCLQAFFENVIYSYLDSYHLYVLNLYGGYTLHDLLLFTKYAVNVCFHLNSYKTPMSRTIVSPLIYLQGCFVNKDAHKCKSSIWCPILYIYPYYLRLKYISKSTTPYE